MLKRIQALFFCFFVVMNVVACSSTDNDRFDPLYKDKVNVVFLEDGTHYAEYAGVSFVPHNEDLIFVEQDEDDVLLGWSGSWWGWCNQYFSSTEDDPMFLYETRIDCLYLHRDYNYKNDTFIIENTDVGIAWNKILGLEQADVDFAPQIEIQLYSEQCSRMKITLQMAYIGRVWYVSFPNFNNVWSPSEDLLNLLLENNLIWT